VNEILGPCIWSKGKDWTFSSHLGELCQGRNGNSCLLKTVISGIRQRLLGGRNIGFSYTNGRGLGSMDLEPGPKCSTAWYSVA
jgi:hypothetical protein